MLRRSGVSAAEWNFFNMHTWKRIFGNLDGWKEEKRVHCFLQSCAYNGFLFPKDHKMYSPRIQKRGMFKHPFEYDILMFESLSHLEWLHFGFMKDMIGVDGKPVPFVLDFPIGAGADFPDLERREASPHFSLLADYPECEFSFSSFLLHSSFFLELTNLQSWFFLFPL